MKDNIIQATVSVAIGALISYFNILFMPKYQSKSEITL